MCGRFTLGTDPKTIQDAFELSETLQLPPRYNIAPSEAVAAIRRPEGDEDRKLDLLRWGFVPAWSKEANVGAKMINARSETVATSPAFRNAFRRRRCLIPADGFYEWQKLERRKQPFYFRMRDGLPFAFAGLWEQWRGNGDQVLETCTILTTEPNELTRQIHNRMPVILDPSDFDRWLDPELNDPEVLRPLFRPYPAERMTVYPVSTLVNSPANDAPDCILPLPDAQLSKPQAADGPTINSA